VTSTQRPGRDARELERAGNILGKFREFAALLGRRRSWTWRHIGGGGMFARYVLTIGTVQHPVSQATAQAWRRRGWIEDVFEKGRGYCGSMTELGLEVLRDAA
jgi:hypothetical protein